MSEYLDVSVIERDSEQGHRENANAINYLLEQVVLLQAAIVDLQAQIDALP